MAFGCRTPKVGERIAMPKWGRVHRDFVRPLILIIPINIPLSLGLTPYITPE